MFLVNRDDMHFLPPTTTTFFFFYLETARWNLVNKDGTSNMFYDPTGMFALTTDGRNSLKPQGGRVEENNAF